MNSNQRDAYLRLQFQFLNNIYSVRLHVCVSHNTDTLMVCVAANAIPWGNANKQMLHLFIVATLLSR